MINTDRLVRCALWFALLCLGGCSRQEPAPAEVAAPEAADENSGPGVTVDAESQKRLGLELKPVISGPEHAVATGTAVVLDSAALVSALDDVAAAASESAAQRENLQRLQHLYNDGGNASLQALEAARSQAATAHARLTAAESHARVDWGAALIDATDPRLRELREKLVRSQAALLRAEFPGELGPDAAQLEYSFAPAANDPGAAIEAQFIERSRAPALAASGEAVTLEVRFADAGGLALRPGQRLSISAADPRAPSRPLVPASAAIADGGQLWCYVARENGRFDRLALAADERVGAGYPAQGLRAEDRVVVRGAPLLLSLERGAGSAPGASSED